MTSEINAAILQLVRRAEGNDTADLVNTFVSVGSLMEILRSVDPQIVYGRRGTGKTHVLQYLAEKVAMDEDLAVYIDLRTVGSNGGIYGDASVPLTERATRLLVDVLTHVYNVLAAQLIAASYGGEFETAEAIRYLDLLEQSITDVRVSGDQEVSTVSATARTENAQSQLSFSEKAASLSFGGSHETAEQSERREIVRGPRRYNVHFGAVSNALSRLVASLPGRLWLVLDEWSDIPLDLQPFLADLLRRSVLSVKGVSVKIGAIEQRSNFSQPDGVGGYIGLELGADIFADLELDEFMVFGNDEERAKTFFGELLYRHVSRFLSDANRSSIANADEFVRRAFTQRNAFAEFVRAVEGVPRDAINIAISAAKIAGDDPISVPHVRQAARQWYLRDKEKSVQASATQLLHWIIDEVIGTRRARAFLLEQGAASRHDLVSLLYDARVLHVIKRGVSANDRPGIRYDVFTLDFGCYVQLVTTTAAPQGLFEIESDGETGAEWVEVPKDDYRSIRRAVLELDAFETRARGFYRVGEKG